MKNEMLPKIISNKNNKNRNKLSVETKSERIESLPLLTLNPYMSNIDSLLNLKTVSLSEKGDLNTFFKLKDNFSGISNASNEDYKSIYETIDKIDGKNIFFSENTLNYEETFNKIQKLKKIEKKEIISYIFIYIWKFIYNNF